jgi:RHS repeat-associated protein
VRAIFDVIDTEGPVATPADYVFLKDPDGGVALTSNIGGPHRGQVWSPWVVPSAGRIQVPFISNATGNTYTGVVMAGYEYQRHQTGAQPFWTPLGFPGQYHDAETDLFQNWNRFYDAAIGRYLESEPYSATPDYPVSEARSGTTYSAFTYAGANPLSNTDPTGNEFDTASETCKHHPAQCVKVPGEEPILPPTRPNPIPPILPPTTPEPSPPPACKDDDNVELCAKYYSKCIQSGGGSIPGRHRGESSCETCRGLCQRDGFWPAAFYRYNGERVPCLGN